MLVFLFFLEILCQFWKLENKIFQGLGSPPKMREEVNKQHRRTIYVHLMVVSVGCASLGVQFYSDPKNCSFTYSVIGADNAFLRVIFCAHEIIFMGHAWFCNAGTNVMVTFMADSLALTLEKLIVHMHTLDEKLKLIQADNLEKAKKVATMKIKVVGNKTSGIVVTDKVNDEIQIKNSPAQVEVVTTDKTQDTGLFLVKTKQRKVSFPKGTGLEFSDLVNDFQRLAFTTRIFNDSIARKLAGLVLTGYCQYVASTCMAFQVIRREHGGIGDIW